MKLNFRSRSKCDSYIFSSLKTQYGMDGKTLTSLRPQSVTHTSFLAKNSIWNLPVRDQSVTLTSFPLAKNSIWNGLNLTSLRPQSVTHTSFLPKTQDGTDETQLPFDLKVSLIPLPP